MTDEKTTNTNPVQAEQDRIKKEHNPGATPEATK